MRLSYYNIGCKVNFADISSIVEQFEIHGYRTVEFGEESDIVLINTCSVTNLADSDCRKIIRRARNISPDAYIGVLGCYAQLKPEEIAQIEGVDGIFGTNEKFNINNIIDKFEKRRQPEIYVSCLDELKFDLSNSADNDSHTRVVLKLQDGCDYRCTFCTIPLARGKSRSMPFGQIENQLIRFESEDIYEVILSGINLGDYRNEDGKTFTEVIKLIDNLDTKMRFRISSIEPNLLKSEIIDIVANSYKICPHFHIPLQSGSTEILRLMKRRYKADYFKQLILDIKEKIPNCSIGVDVITGFPGESDSHFQETYDLIDLLPVSYLHVFTYSERDNTPATQLPSKVPQSVKKERTNVLRHLSESKKRLFYLSQVGSMRTIIPESYDGMSWSGWTENYVKVKFSNYNGTESIPIKVKLLNYNNGFILAEKI